jgi:hypothetical protein
MGLHRSACRRLGIEVLEDRCLLSAGSFADSVRLHESASVAAWVSEAHQPGQLLQDTIRERTHLHAILQGMIRGAVDAPQLTHRGREDPGGTVTQAASPWLLHEHVCCLLAEAAGLSATPDHLAGRMSSFLSSLRSVPEEPAVEVVVSQSPPPSVQPPGTAGVASAQDNDEGKEYAELTPEPGGALAGLLPLDVGSLQRIADAALEQLARLTAPREGDSWLLLGPWLAIAGTVACELALLPGVLRRTRPALPEGPAWPEEEP